MLEKEKLKEQNIIRFTEMKIGLRDSKGKGSEMDRREWMVEVGVKKACYMISMNTADGHCGDACTKHGRHVVILQYLTMLTECDCK